MAQPGLPATQPGSDYCAVVYPDRPLRNGITVEPAELRAGVLSKLESCNGAHPSVTVPDAVPATSSATARAKVLTDQGLAYEELKQYDAALRASQLSDDKENALRVYEKLKPLDAQVAADLYQEIQKMKPAK